MIGTAFLKDGTSLWGEITHVANGVSVFDSAKRITTHVSVNDLDRVEMDLLEIPTGEPQVQDDEVEAE